MVKCLANRDGTDEYEWHYETEVGLYPHCKYRGLLCGLPTSLLTRWSVLSQRIVSHHRHPVRAREDGLGYPASFPVKAHIPTDLYMTLILISPTMPPPLSLLLTPPQLCRPPGLREARSYSQTCAIPLSLPCK